MQRERLWCRWLVMVVLLGTGVSGWGCANQVRFSRKKSISYTKLVSIPDEAVIYMQNLSLMKDLIPYQKLSQMTHLELVLPARLLTESVRLKSGNTTLPTFNIHRKKVTRIRVREIQRYLTPNKPLIVEYLTWGVFWRAQYRIDLLPNDKMDVQLNAMITNNWFDLSRMKVTLVAGWVGSSSQSSLLSSASTRPKPVRLSALPGPAVAGLGTLTPLLAFGVQPGAPVMGVSYTQQTQQQKRTYQFKSKTRAFGELMLRKYRIKRIDATGTRLRSNYQKQLRPYYSQQRSAPKASGFALYQGLEAHLRLREKSIVQVASAQVPTTPIYMWPADRADDTLMVYPLSNRSKVLFPKGVAWLYRSGIYVGQDVCLWTPIGGTTRLLTSNDGKVAVSRKLILRKDGSSETSLHMRNVSDKPAQIHVFDKNPTYHEKGTLTFNIAPQTHKQHTALHRWELTLPKRTSQTIKMTFKPLLPTK